MARRRKPSYRQWPDVTTEMLQLAGDRTSFLCEPHILHTKTVTGLLANAYLQGVADCAEIAADIMLRRDSEGTGGVTKRVPEGLG